MRSVRVDSEAVEEPAELLRRDVHGLKRVIRPVKAMLLQALVPETKAVSVPIEHFESIAPAVAEYEKIAGKGIQGQKP